MESMGKPVTPAQKKALWVIEKELGIKFKGATKEQAYRFTKHYMRQVQLYQMKKKQLERNGEL